MQHDDLIHRYRKVIMTLRLVNASITLYTYFFFEMKSFKIYSLNFQVKNAALQITVIMLKLDPITYLF